MKQILEFCYKSTNKSGKENCRRYYTTHAAQLDWQSEAKQDDDKNNIGKKDGGARRRPRNTHS
jgi:hypothetical protein